MRKYKRIFLIVIDSMGIGEMPDAADFGDVNVNTLGHVAQSRDSFVIPNLARLGLGNLCEVPQIGTNPNPEAITVTLREKSCGKDTMTGHWEMMGIHTTKPFVTFTDTGFPPELIQALEEKTGRKIIGNKSASGTEILEELGEREIQNGELIVYTSADSVLQICGNEETMGVETLYRYCEIARKLTMKPEWRVGRVIARPYTGRKKGEFVRTANRHDYAVKPTGRTVLDALKDAGLDVISVGKIRDIFDGEGITQAYKSSSSVHGMEQTIDVAKSDFTGLCFTNLVDFDALWGHRRNPVGYGDEIERFDEKLGELLPLLQPDDLLMITADHGNDPTYTGTDHTREKVPFIIYSPSMKGVRPVIGEQETFAVIGATIADNFGVTMPEGTIGTSLYKEIVGEKTMDIQKILHACDHTLLKQESTWTQIQALLDDAIRYQTASVCIPPCYVAQASEYAAGRMTICTVIGFPNGNMTTATKAFETEDAIKNGATEIDMVINIGWVKEGAYYRVGEEIDTLANICHARGAILKVIIETCLLTEEEKIAMCHVVSASEADFIKTSTGFSTAGATFADVELMRRYCSPDQKIKAAGGIASLEDAEKFMALGAERLGTSRVVKIVKEMEK